MDTLHLDNDHAVFPEDGDCFAAMGAALCATDYPSRPFEECLKLLEESVDATTALDVMPPLFINETLGESGHGLIHYRLEDRGSHILLPAALVQDGLDVAFCENSAPGYWTFVLASTLAPPQ